MPNNQNSKIRINWTLKTAHERALQYNTLGKFRDKATSAYNWALKNGYLDQITSHMTTSCKRNNHWNRKNCAEEALKYNTRSSFRKNAGGAYHAAHKIGFLDEICSHMPKQRKKGFWSKAECRKRALLYKFKKDFKEYDPIAYQKAHSKGWLNEICAHMEEIIKPANHWHKEKCAECAFECSSRSEFKKRFNSAYIASRKNGWIDEICSHMKPLGNTYKRYIYVYEFVDNIAYIGLTFDFEARKKGRENKKDSVWQKTQNTKFEIILSEKAFHLEQAVKKEKGLIKQYKSEGWKLINRTNGGETGTPRRKYSFKNLEKLASQYNSKSEFRQAEASAYRFAQKYSYLDDICKHMTSGRKHWDEKKILLEALKYTNKKDFQKYLPSAYQAARYRNILGKACSHMTETFCLRRKIFLKPRGFWTYRNCLEEAKKYKKKSDFRKNAAAAFDACTRNGWLDEACKHMEVFPKWTFIQCLKASKFCKNKIEFRKRFAGAYDACWRNNWLDEIFS